MTYTLENEHLIVSINAQGAELSSIISKQTNTEYLWQADPKIWGSHAPVLFPIVGGVKNGEYTHNNNNYSINKHGFIRNNTDIEVVDHNNSTLRLALEFSEKTLAMYPFKFRFAIEYRLIENHLSVTHKVENLDVKPIFFSTGAHPGFNCPHTEGEHYSDFYIEFEEKENAGTYSILSNGLLTDTTTPILDKTKILPLSDTIFDNDALVFKHLKSKSVTLKSTTSTKELKVSFDGFNYLGIWAKPKAPFVCIEPWNGLPDIVSGTGNFEDKEGIKHLHVGGVYTDSYTLTINE